MASETVRAVLLHICNVLKPLGYPYALMGGVALAAWNHPRATRDVDLLIAIDRKSIDSLIEQLISHGCRPKRYPPLIVVEEHSFVQFLYTPPDEFYEVQFDLLLVESELQKSAIQRRLHRNVIGLDHGIDVLSCDDLLLFKLVAGRMIDRADAAMLLRENRLILDFEYLSSWVERLKIGAIWVEIWAEAFPDEPLRNE